MSEVLNSKLAEIKSSLLKTVELAKMYGAEDMKQPSFYKKIVDDFCESNMAAKSSHDTIKKASNCETLEEFDKVIKEQKRKSSKSESNLFLDEIKQILNTTSNNENRTQIYEDGMVVQNTISSIDPVTKKRIVNPVRNKRCGHVYDKSSIMEALKMNNRLRCPVAGCGLKTFILAADLIEDVQYRMQLENSGFESN